MRARILLPIVVLLALVAGRAPAHAQPTGLGRKPTPAQQAELDKLDKQLYALQAKQAYVAAIRIARKLYVLQRKASGDDSLHTWRRKQTLAGMLSAAGDYVEAHKLYEQLLRDAERQHGAKSREVLTALMPLTGLYWQQSRYDELELVYQRMLALSKQLDGERSQGYAGLLTAYGSMLYTRNEYSSAQRVYEQVLAIDEAIAGRRDDPSVIQPLMMLGSLYWTTKQQARATAAYDRAIKISQADPKATAVAKGSTMWSAAATYHYGGRPDLARPLVAKIIATYQAEITRLERTTPDDWQLPTVLGLLGALERQQGNLAAAEQAYVKAIALAKKRGAFTGYEAQLAELKRAQGKPREALALYEQAAAALAKVAPQSATSFNLLIADVLRELGELKRAERLLAAHRAYLAKTFGKRHPVYGAAELAMAYVYIAGHRIAQAEAMLTDSLELAEKDLQLVLQTGTESDHAIYFERNHYQLDTAVNFAVAVAPRSRSAAKLALTTLLRRKGRVLDAAAASLATLRAKLSPADKQLLDDLAAARAKLAKLHVAGPQATGGDDYAKAVAALEDQIQKLELEIARHSAAYRAASAPIVLPAIQKMIPKDARLIELVNYQPGDARAPYAINPKLPPRRYAAFVVGRTGDPAVIDLGPVGPIDTAVAAFRKAVADPRDAHVVERGQALYRLTMAKIAPRLGGATNLLLAPDGTLNVVPFSALADDKREFLVKRYTFTYLTSGRDLLRLAVKTRAQGGGVVFADPAFDATGKPAPAGGTTRGARSVDLASLAWPRLPGTAEEADLVTKTMHGLTVYRRARATEGALKALHGPRVLHLATHGFFLPDEPPPKTPAAARGGPAAPPQPHENPLLRSGLALAGANKLRSGDDDGILTAMEAAGLDLWGTKLVVLSACETGVGKVTNGDGVYGLRRALVIAGAESLVMTLWQVDDAATKDLMAGYYLRLARGRPRSSALRDVQLELAAQPKYAHPYYWASFVPAGANTPLAN